MFSISPQHSDDYDQDEVDSDDMDIDIDSTDFRMSQMKHQFNLGINKSKQQCKHTKGQTCQNCSIIDTSIISRLLEKESKQQYHWEQIDTKHQEDKPDPQET